MSLPVSQYEALLAQVRGLRRQAQHVQQLADPLLYTDADRAENQNVTQETLDYTMDTLHSGSHNEQLGTSNQISYLMDTVLIERHNYEISGQKMENETSEDESIGALSTNHSVSSEPISQTARNLSLNHGTWPVERTMWNSEPTALPAGHHPSTRQLDVPSVMSFASSSGAPIDRALITPDRSSKSSQQLEAKVDMVYSLLAMLGGQEHADMEDTLLALSTNPESCLAMRQSGCIPLLVELVQSDRDNDTRQKASKALLNLVYSQPDEKLRKRETKIFKLLEIICAYNEALKNDLEFVCENLPEDGDKHPVQTIAHLMKLSFDECHRQAICQLGGIYTISKLVEAEHSIHGSTTDETHCILMRRYACMALTNLTFGDSGNKALLCSYKDFIRALVVQLQSPSDELRQVTASVLRNLSWRADSSSKIILKEVGSVKALMRAAMLDNKENTLKSILSALWNLSAHCTENKAEICSTVGSLEFLVRMLSYKSTLDSLAIIENAGGILRNISSQIAVRDDYRAILREHNCLQILLDQLKSPSLTIVSNACGTLWNLSAKNSTDQEILWQKGAPAMLRSLNHSKHKMIAMGSSATLKNLLSAKPGQALLPHMDSTALSLDLPTLPTLGARKQKALLKDLDQNLSETFDNIEPSSDVKKKKDKQNQKQVFPSLNSPPETPNSFASLNICEPSTSVNHERKSRIPQSSGPSSLPYMGSEAGGICTSTPIRRKFPEEETVDEPSGSGRKSMKHKFRSGISTRKNSVDVARKTKESKSDVSSGYVEIGSEYSTDVLLQFSDRESVTNSVESGRVVGVSQSPLRLEFETDKQSVIDNDKHSVRRQTKEIASMDEKDHCSTEDISDSETHPAKSIQSNRLTQNNEPRDGRRNFELDSRVNLNTDVSTSNLNRIPTFSTSNSSTGVDENTKTPIVFVENKPQPSPRSFVKPPSPLRDDGAMFQVDVNGGHLSADVKSFNIPKQQQSVEDNTLQKEDFNEKQDTEKEKKANTMNEFEKSLPLSCMEETGEASSNETSSNVPHTNSSINLDEHGVGKPVASRNDFFKSCGDSERNEVMVNKPKVSNETSVSHLGENPISIGTACAPRPSNLRTEEAEEATKASNEDLNRKLDIFSRQGEHAISRTDGNDDRDGFDSVKDCREKEVANTTNTSTVDLNISQENNSTLTSMNSEKCLPSEDSSSGVRNDSGPAAARSKTSPRNGNSTEEGSYASSASPEGFVADHEEERLERSCNGTANVLDSRMLDPDAMIESLDRFTAELVSQASSHLQNKESLYKSSANDNTWDENSSRNDVTFPTVSVSAPNVISFKSDSAKSSGSNSLGRQEQNSNDFSSYNTSTMTESTLIAMEAAKVTAALKESAEMSMSVNSLASLELDRVPPPSHLNSLSNSMIGFDSKPDSPTVRRKKSLPSNIMVRRALNHSLSHNASTESLSYDKELTENSSSSGSEARKRFQIDGPVNKDFPHMATGIKAPSSLLHFVASNYSHSITDIENINPPSLLNEITDMCNSLADIPTSAICSETEVFEDCFTHVLDNTLQTENDVTEFSDANSITPIQSDANSSSNENTPKRQKTLSRSLTSKQRRSLAKERYKTYTIAAEMVMKESLINEMEKKEEEPQSECFNTAMDSLGSMHDEATYTSPTFTVDTKSTKLSPKERRLSERMRFQTQVLEVSQLENIQQPKLAGSDSDASNNSPQQSPVRSKISVRKNFCQRRLSNKERFKTQTLEESSLSPDLNNVGVNDSELFKMVETEANKVLKTLRDTKTTHDELLDCETMSLVSNDDESEHNSGSSGNYRTYHKSWGLRHNIPIINPIEPTNANVVVPVNDPVFDSLGNDSSGSISEGETNKVLRKPKIVKPDESKVVKEDVEVEEPKGIRGRRKPLYSKSNINKIIPKTIKPVKNVSSNLVKNVTSTLKSSSPKTPVITKSSKISSKPPLYQGKSSNTHNASASKTSSPQKFARSTSSVSQKTSPKHSTLRPSSEGNLPSLRPLERQGTFTKDDSPVSTPQPQIKSKIPSFTSRIPSATASKQPSRIPSKQTGIPRSGLYKSASSDRNPKETNIKMYNRSSSADSRESATSRRIQSSLSSQSLKSDPGKMQQNGAIKKTVPNQRSNVNTPPNGSNNTKKQVTSKIASIWKKIEESKKKGPPKADCKKWIEAQAEPDSDVPDMVDETSKRVSRLGSFIVMDENDDSLQ